MGLEAAIDLAERQRGVLARHQLVRALGDDDRADNLLRTGWFGPLDPPIRGVHRVRGSARAPEQVAFAAALRSRPGATVTGPLALALLGIGEFTTGAPFEILLQPGRRLSQVPFAHRRDPDPDRPVALHGEVRVAGPIDALIDAAGFVDQVGPRSLRVAWDHLRWRGLARAGQLGRRIELLRGVSPGAEALEHVLHGGGGIDPESEGERGLAAVLLCFEPRPEPQVWVTPGRRTDFYFRPLRLGVEYLGGVDHAHVAGRIADDQRDAELREEGIRLHYVTAGDLREPRTLLATIAGMLTVRAHELGARPPVAVRPLPSARAA